MAREKTTNTEKLLKEIKKKGGMTRVQMVKRLLQFAGQGAKSYDSKKDRGLYGSLLYGTSTRQGILERFCTKQADGTYKVTKKIKGPFTAPRPTKAQNRSQVTGGFTPAVSPSALAPATFSQTPVAATVN